VSRALISLIAQFVDPALRRYAPPRGGWNIVDDRLRAYNASLAPGTTGLLLYLQRTRSDLPEHVACNRGSWSGRLEALRFSLPRDSPPYGFSHRCSRPCSIRQPDRPRRRVRGAMSTLLCEHGCRC